MSLNAEPKTLHLLIKCIGTETERKRIVLRNCFHLKWDNERWRVSESQEDAKKGKLMNSRWAEWLVLSLQAFSAVALEWEGPDVSTGRFSLCTKGRSRMCSQLPNCTMGQEGVGLSFGNKEKMHSCSQDFKVEDEELLCKWTGISWVSLYWDSVFSKSRVFYYFCLNLQIYINLTSSPLISSSR